MTTRERARNKAAEAYVNGQHIAGHITILQFETHKAAFLAGMAFAEASRLGAVIGVSEAVEGRAN